MTKMRYETHKGLGSDTLTDPATLLVQIYSDPQEDGSGTRLYYKDSSRRLAFDVKTIELDVDKDVVNPKIRFQWRDAGTQENIEVTDTPAATPKLGSGYTEYELSTPNTRHASFDYVFKEGVPGFRLAIKVKRK